MKKHIAIASDHAGVEMKALLKKEIESEGFAVDDLGPQDTASVDYPDFANALVDWVKKNSSQGVLICGSGIGMSIAANRHKGIRAALVHNQVEAELSRKHNNANVLCLGARTTDEKNARAAVKAFLTTDFEGGRHEKRVEKLG